MSRQLPPLPPPGTNPWQWYANELDRILFPDPSAGFRWRLIWCIVLNGLALVVNLCGYALFVLRQRQRGAKLWFVRRVTVRDTKFVLMSPNVAGTFALACSSVCALGSCAELWRIYINHELRQAVLRDWQMAFMLPFILCGWALCWSSLFAYLHVIETSAPGMSAAICTNKWVLRSLSYGLGVLITAGLICATALSSISHRRAWRMMTELLQRVEARARSWPGPSATDTADIQRALSETDILYRQVDRSVSRTRGLYITYIVTIVTVATVHLSSIALTFLIRRQIKENVKALSVTSMTPSRALRDATGTSMRSTIGQDRALAPESGHQHARLRELQRVEKIQWIFSSALFVMASIPLVPYIFYLVRNERLLSQWSAVEFFYTILWWILGALTVLAAGTFIAVELYYSPLNNLDHSGQSGPRSSSAIEQVQVIQLRSTVVEHAGGKGDKTLEDDFRLL